MRNSVTGCRLAVELHARQCHSAGENLEVAMRQLALMERYLQRFLASARRERLVHKQTDLIHVVDNVLALVGPNARHQRVQLIRDVPQDSVFVSGDRDALEQLLTNLVLNAIEASSQVGQVTVSIQASTALRGLW
jgi:signal transduction histidine kinase